MHLTTKQRGEGLQSRVRFVLDSSWNVMAHGDVREGKWWGNWRTEWVVSTLHTTSEHGVSSITTADTHTSAASSRLNWRPPADLNGLVRFAERRNMVCARVPSHFNWPLLNYITSLLDVSAEDKPPSSGDIKIPHISYYLNLYNEFYITQTNKTHIS